MIGLFVVILMLLACPVFAAVESGTRVRVTLLARETAPRLVGTVLSIVPDTLVLSVAADSSQRTLPRASIAKLEVSQGMRSNTLKGMYTGALLLGIPAAVLGYEAGKHSLVDGGQPSPVSNAVIGFGVGAVIGAGIGALFGSLGHHERWKEVEP